MYEIIDEKYFKIPLVRKKIDTYSCSNKAIIEVIVPYTEEKDNIQVVFELSKDAMIGFGTALIRLYNKGFPEKIDIRTEPLESVGGGNQPLGFWLTCESTSLYVYHKEFNIKNDSMLVKYEHNLLLLQ